MRKIIITTPEELKQLIAEVYEDHVNKHSHENCTQNSSHDKKYYSRAETAKQLQISLVTLTKYVKEGVIECHRVGNRVLFKKEAIDKAIIKRNFGNNGY